MRAGADNQTVQRDQGTPIVDVRHLPTFGFGPPSIMWWSTMGLVLIESTVFAIAIVSYFYLRSVAPVWPINSAYPDLLWGSMNTGIMVLSLLPNQLAKNASERKDRRACALWMIVCLLCSVLFLVVRGFEFTTLNVNWDTNAYGSIVWMLLGLHTTHLVTDTLDSAILGALLLWGPFESKRYVDVNESGMYWYFVVFSWVPIYATIYWAPRL
jgi:heme/copper-type cytochrome/quinol oxidase subunit 3